MSMLTWAYAYLITVYIRHINTSNSCFHKHVFACIFPLGLPSPCLSIAHIVNTSACQTVYIDGVLILTCQTNLIRRRAETIFPIFTQNRLAHFPWKGGGEQRGENECAYHRGDILPHHSPWGRRMKDAVMLIKSPAAVIKSMATKHSLGLAR